MLAHGTQKVKDMKRQSNLFVLLVESNEHKPVYALGNHPQRHQGKPEHCGFTGRAHLGCWVCSQGPDFTHCIERVQHTLGQLKELLMESSPFQGRLPSSISFKALQHKLEQVSTVLQLCQEVLGIEGAVSLLGSGPRGAF